MSRKAVLALVAAFSILSAGVGWVLGQQIKSPAEIAAAAAPPTPSLITVPVERQELSSQIVVRALLAATEATPINVLGSAVGTPVITGMTKNVGDELVEGDVVVEVSGRPLIVLEGVLPLYRALGPGMSGPDVEQLQEALVRLGYDPGPVDGIYADATAGAVAQLYQDRGYEVTTLLDNPDAAVGTARDQLAAARQALEQLGSGSTPQIPGGLEDLAQGVLDGGVDGGVLAGLAQQFLGGSTQLSPELAQGAVDAAQQRLAEVEDQAGAAISRYEVVFVPTLPRVVQSVSVRVGSVVEGPVMTISGTETTLTSVLSSVDRELVEEGVEAIVDDGNLGFELPAQVTFLADRPGGEGIPGDRFVMELKPLVDFPEAALNKSLRVTIPVSSTGGEVLTVPVAAVSSSANRETRVEVEIAEGQTRLVPIETGLAANGFVEVIPIEGGLDEGDRVVVGQDLMALTSSPSGEAAAESGS